MRADHLHRPTVGAMLDAQEHVRFTLAYSNDPRGVEHCIGGARCSRGGFFIWTIRGDLDRDVQSRYPWRTIWMSQLPFTEAWRSRIAVRSPRNWEARSQLPRTSGGGGWTRTTYLRIMRPPL